MSHPDLSAGLCIGHPNPEIWDVKGGVRNNPKVIRAIRICGICPVQQACLDYVIQIERANPGAYGHTYGVAGGLTARQRKFARKVAA